ncbi:MAG: hypothetical protein B6I36_02920 [Desulfobacteraceae bacterium 4572_35.1]|nr:MAG: hypothetical protein B6I36_02920 [Desulfobacteraceae bacterium 4572_35.1]
MIESIGTTSLESFRVEAHKLLENTIKKNQEEQQTNNSTQQDKVSLGNKPVETGTYTAAVSDAELGKTFTMLRDLFAATLKEQGVATLVANGSNDINIESLTPEEATELVSDDGYFGVDNTAKRIFDFATGMANNDPSRLNAIIDGINDGFAEAEKAWGGTLPEISYATRDSLQTMLEDWSGQEVDLGGDQA